MADTEALVNQLDEFAEKRDFEGAFGLVRENQGVLGEKLRPAGVRDALKKTTTDRLLLSFLDGVEFGARPLGESLVHLEKLIGFTPGSLVLSKAWGLGEVKKIDYFYRRVTVDFKTKKGHQFTYAAAVDMLETPPEGHILVLRRADPVAFEAMLKDRPGDFVKAVLKSYGDLPVTRLEDVCVQNGFVKSVNWKGFWDRARADLRRDKLVEIPAKRADPIRLKAAEEDYGEGWLTAFAHETDPKLILAAVREFVAQKKLAEAGEDERARIGERLVFAATAARKVDDALYARLACLVSELGFAQPPAEEMRAYLWERKRFVKAAAALPAREVGAMIAFLACDDAAKERLYKAIPDLCFTAVVEIAEQFGGEGPCRAAIGAYMREPKAPATLTTLLVGKYERFREWKELPALITLLTHAIALGEGRQGGETLKMQNLVRRLFGDRTWLEKVFGWLTPADQALFFERFQASIAWDPSTHHTTVVRMANIVPELKAHLVTEEEGVCARHLAAQLRPAQAGVPEAHQRGHAGERQAHRVREELRRPVRKRRIPVREGRAARAHAEADADAGRPRGGEARRLRRRDDRRGDAGRDGRHRVGGRGEGVDDPRRVGQRPRARHPLVEDARRAEPHGQEGRRRLRAARRRRRRRLRDGEGDTSAFR